MKRPFSLSGMLTVTTFSAADRHDAEPMRKASPANAHSIVETYATIGSATQEADGTIILDRRAERPEGATGDARLRYRPTDKGYRTVARYVGPIPKGGSVLVKPFPSPAGFE